MARARIFDDRKHEKLRACGMRSYYKRIGRTGPSRPHAEVLAKLRAMAISREDLAAAGAVLPEKQEGGA